MALHKNLRTLASTAICGCVLALCLIPTLPWAQSRGGTRVKETIAPPEKQFTGSYALLVGVSQYKHWSNLPGVEVDIAAMERLLIAQGFEVQKAFPKSREELELAYTRFISLRGQTKHNRLVLYFAGHGVSLPLEYSDGQKMGYILAPEAPRLTDTNREQVRQAALDLDTMFAYARRINSLHALFVFDSCFAGDFLSRGEPSASNLYVDYLASRPIRQFITAGGAGETVPDRSLFRKMLERALGEAAADGNQDGYVTGTELKTYLQETVMYYSKGTQHPQYGVMRDPDLDKGDFIFKVNRPHPPPTPTPTPTPTPAPAPIPKPTPVPEEPGVALAKRLGITWIPLPGGTFTMGSKDGESDEKDPHPVTLSSFKMTKTEITNAQYNACVKAGKCEAPSWDDNKCRVWTGSEWKEGKLPESFRGDHQPVVCVDWFQARAYAKWVAENGEPCARLPTEAEWEYAARGTEGRKYPWGKAPEPDCDRAIFDPTGDVGNGCGTDTSATVCSKEKGNTTSGLCDMAGNVWEWTEDCYHDSYKDAPSDGSAWTTGCREDDDAALRVSRGGSWDTVPDWLRSSYRGWAGARRRYDYQGFRLVSVPSLACTVRVSP